MSPAEHDIGPIPLTVFEKYFLLDSTPEFPMLVEGILRLKGGLDRQAFETAVARTLRKHPLFTRRIERHWGRYRWTRENEPFAVDWIEAPVDWESRDWSEPMNLFEKAGFELHVYVQEKEASVYYRIHHLCCDGAGFFSFFSDLCAEYARLKGETIEESVVEPERIFDRDKFPPLELPEKIGFFKRMSATATEVLKWMAEKPMPLIGNGESGDGGDRGRFGKMIRHFSVSETKIWRDRARSKNCSLNDLLLSTLFVLLEKRSLEQEIPEARRFHRVMIPLNMRWPGTETVPASNIISYVFLTRRGDRCDWSANLLDEIHGDVKAIKDYKIGFMFLNSLRFFDRLPGGLRMMTGNKNCLASVVFTNTGDLQKFFEPRFPRSEDGKISFGGMRLEQVDSFVPCRSGTNLTLSASVQYGRLSLSCQFDRRYMTHADVDVFLSDLRNELSNPAVVESIANETNEEWRALQTVKQ